MIISTMSSTVNETRESTIEWLLNLLEQPTFSGGEKPSHIMGYIYIDNIPKRLTAGFWQISGSEVYLAGPSSNFIEPITKFGILTAIANITGVIESPVIIDALSRALTRTIAEIAVSAHNGIIRSAYKPSKLAINQTMYQIAALKEGVWCLPSGVRTEVDNSWITIDF